MIRGKSHLQVNSVAIQITRFESHREYVGNNLQENGKILKKG
jgi:hypothetical protein